jgi:V8-like Glu-specific endopeptidase
MRVIIIFLACIVSFTIHSQVSSEGHPLQWNDSDYNPQTGIVVMPNINVDALLEEDANSDHTHFIPRRFGVEHDVQLSIENSGVWTIENDYNVWRLGIKCPDALSISFILSKYLLPKGAKLFIWNQARTEFLGSFTDRNNKEFGSLAIGLISGSSVVLEYQVPLSNLVKGELEIGKVIHGYRSLLGQNLEIQERSGPFGTSTLTCHKDVNCPLGIDWQVEKKAVTLIVCGGACCTGALINNTSENGAPYLLTANHCVNEYGGTFDDPLFWVYYFNHETTSCNAATYTTNQSISGGILAAWSSTTDFALIELTENPQTYYDVIYAGWDKSEHIAWHVTSIHHPAGDSKMISAFYDPLDPSWSYQVNSYGVQAWWVPHWSAGTVEPGSSGAPLFDDNHRIIGQLWGGGVGANCDINDWQESNVNFYSWYGRFDLSWNLGLSTYLDPGNTGLQTLDAYDPNAVYDGGCIDPYYCNYDPSALFDDGSCTVDDICGICGGDGSTCLGCTDSIACNYDPNAISDNGSCTYADFGYDCDGNCTYGDLDGDGICDACETMEYIIVECFCEYFDPLTYTVFFIDVDEVNCITYEDCYCVCINDINGDGICDPLCSEDINSDGIVSVQDLLLVLSEFGCISLCENDVNQDGYVTVDDILLLLSEFGNICE